MKRILYLIIIFCPWFLRSICGQDTAGKINSLVGTYYQNGVFNGVVLVSKKGQIIYKKAFGMADREWNIPITIDSKFKIASLSKSFTALAVLQLVQEGKIRLDGTIKDYIPDYSGRAGDSITIRNLLTHTSGIRSNLEPKEELVQQRLYHTLRDMVKYAESADLLFKPGTKFGYSNFGYNILAYIVEIVTGKPFHIVLKEKIFDPAGMINSSQYDNNLVEKKLVKGYEYKLLYGYRNADFVDASLTVGPGGLISTAGDLELFDRAMYSQKLLSNKYLAWIFTPNKPGNYGYGWFISKKALPGNNDSIIIADHAGSIDGFGSYMARIMSDSLFVVVLKNQRSDTFIDPAYAPDIGRQIISVIYGENVNLPKISIARHIASLIGNFGIDSAITEYYRVTKNDSYRYNLDESELNRLGIELLFNFKMSDAALKIFELNMKQFPKSYNTYDSYAYVLKEKGDFVNSIKFYKKGLEILSKYPEANNLNSVKKDADQAVLYIKEMEAMTKPDKN
jgi:CubicO group peptidase (beta-lactamase class C family)